MSTPADFTFRELLKGFRTRQDFSQQELAEVLGVTRLTISNWERGRFEPEMLKDPYAITQLAQALNLSPVETAQLAHAVGLASEEEQPAQPIPAQLNPPVRQVAPPLERPPRAEYFQGRKMELVKLLQNLQPGKVTTLCGPGGIGKTALAAEALWVLAPADAPPERFPDGIIFHSFYNQGQAALALEHIARSFGEEPKPTPQIAAQRALARRQALLVLDGAEAADDLQAVLAVRNRCGVLVTTRRRADAVAKWQDLSSLPVAAAVALLQAWGGPRAKNRQAVQRICTLVGYLPLAVRLIGRYLVEQEIEATEYLALLEKTPLTVLDQGKRQLESVPLLLERSLAQVSERARYIMAVIGLLALTSFTHEPLTAALAFGPAETVNFCGELVNYGLLTRNAQAYEMSHPLIYTYARQRLTPALGQVKRLAEYYTDFIDKHGEDFAQLNNVRPHVIATLRGCLDHAAWLAAGQLARAIDSYLEFQGYWTDRLVTAEVGVKTARALQDQQAEGDWLGRLGATHADLGQYQPAITYHGQALVMARELGDRQSESKHLNNLGVDYYGLGEISAAIDSYQPALAIAREIRDPQCESNALCNLGLAYVNQMQYQSAIHCYQEALIIYKAIGDRSGISAILGNLGFAYASLGQYQNAIDYYQEALTIDREMGNRQYESIVLDNLGSTYVELGQYQTAVSYHLQAAVISREIGDRFHQCLALGNLAAAFASLGQSETAIDYYQQSLEIGRQIGNRRNEGIDLGNLGRVYASLGQHQQAIDCYQQALAIARAIGNPRNESANLDNLGVIYYDLGRLEDALDYFEQALPIVREIGLQYGEGEVLKNLGNTYRQLGQVDVAIHYFEQALAIFEAIKSPEADVVRGWLDNATPSAI